MPLTLRHVDIRQLPNKRLSVGEKKDPTLRKIGTRKMYQDAGGPAPIHSALPRKEPITEMMT